MSTFARLLRQEHPAIHAALDRAVLRLPRSVRDISGYVLLAGGKRLRPMLTLISGRLFGCERPDLYDLAAVLEMIHVASLLHDDVLDDADTRRGRQAAHLVYGVSPCLLAGDALLASASYHVATYGNPALVECVSEAMMRTVAGEAREIALKGSLEHGMEEYLDIVTDKTGWLIRAACRLGALFAGADEDRVRAVSDFGLNAGIAFQMVDDALDFEDEAVTGKPTGGDLREGKFTPPIMRYAESLPPAERADFGVKFSEGLFTDDEIAAVSRRIRAQGFAARTRDMAGEYLARAARALETLPDRPERAVFRQVLDFVRDREA